MAHITFDPYIPLALWAPLALAAAALLGWYAVTGRRRLPARAWWPIVALMTLAAAVPLVILLNPTWVERVPPPAGKPLLTVLVDRSASMATSDSNGKTRYETAVACAAAVERELNDRYEVRIRGLADTSAPASAESLSREKPDGRATNLASGVQDALEDDCPQGQAILLLSDGIHNVGGIEPLRESVAKAKAMAAPVFVKPLGGNAAVNDLEVNLAHPQELAFVGQRVPVAVSVRCRGATATKTSVSLSLDGKPAERRDVTLKPNGVVEEVFYLSHKTPGLYRYDVRAETVPGEVTALNNTSPLLLRVVDQPVRVLLLEGKPYWDTKFLVRTLSGDPSIELTSVVQLAEGRLLQRNIPRTAIEEPKTDKKPDPKNKADKNAATGDDRQQWTIEKDAGKLLSDAGMLATYQIVILGRNAEAFLTDDALTNLRKWLAEGEGSLVCFRGPPAAQINQRLGELMPMRWTAASESRFHVQLTNAGQSLHWLPLTPSGENQLSDLPSLATSVRPEAAKALAIVLATGAAGNSAAGPVMVYQPVGNGRVVVVEGAGMWRWAFLPPERQKQEEIYGSLWRSLVRWLVANVGLLPSQKWSLRADKLSFNTDENATATLLLRDPSAKSPQVTLTGGALEKPRHLACVPRGSSPGQYAVGLGRLGEGRYSLSIDGSDKNDLSAVATFDVRGDLSERLDVQAQPNVMKLVADGSGGAVLESAQPRLLAQQFDEHLGRTRPERITQTMAWDRWWVLIGALAIWGAAWGLRRRSGLV